MKKLSIIIGFVFLFVGNTLLAQTNEQKIYIGAGVGLDYGGIIGGKIEYLPEKHLGLFVGLGSNLYSLGWNLGASYKILPDMKISPNLMAFYGCNAILRVEGIQTYNVTSNGFTIGGNLDIKVNSKGDKLSIGLFFPFRSDYFNDYYNRPDIEIKREITSIVISVGFNLLSYWW